MEDLKLDIRELEGFLGQAQRGRVRDLLLTELDRCGQELRKMEKERTAPQEQAKEQKPAEKIKPADSFFASESIKNYSWDQNEDFVTLPNQNIH